jgi:hypothetical protein
VTQRLEHPDIEKITAKYLREHSRVQARSARVVAHPPEDTEVGPWCMVTLIPSGNQGNSAADHVVPWYVQVDCYPTKAGGLPQANALALTVRSVLGEMPDASHEGGVVTAVSIREHGRVPDPMFEPARDRVIIGATITAHPVAVAA